MGANKSSETGDAKNTSFAATGSTRNLPGQVVRVEYWVVPHGYIDPKDEPKNIELSLHEGKETLSSKNRSFLLISNKKEEYYTLGLVDGSTKFEKLSRKARVELRMSKSTKGYKMIRVVVNKQIKPYLTAEQMEGPP